MQYGIYENGYTTISIFDDYKEAKEFCEKANEKIIKRKVKGKVKIEIKNTNRFHVKNIK